MKLYNAHIDEGGNPAPCRWAANLAVEGWESPEDFLPGDPNGEKFKAEKKEEARLKAVRERAENIVDNDDARVMAEQIKRERSGAESSWAFADIRAAYDAEPILPAVGAFIDNSTSNGGGVFYAGKINEIHGASESGKTMLLLAVAAQEIRLGNHVVMIDFEDDVNSVIGRMHYVFGLTLDALVDHFHYMNPSEAFNDHALASIEAIEGNVTFGIIDAVTEAMAANGLDGRKENEVAEWYMSFPRKLADLGMAVALVDHTPQGDGVRAIGSQHKKSAITGVSYTAESVSKFSRGRKGKLRLRVAKDKLSGVRPNALPGGDGTQEWRGDLVIDSSAPGTPQVGLWGVDPGAFQLQQEAKESSLDKGLVEGPTWEEKKKVLYAVEKSPGLSKNSIKAMVGGKGARASMTIEYMVNSGELVAEKQGQMTAHFLPPEPVPDHGIFDDRFPV